MLVVRVLLLNQTNWSILDKGKLPFGHAWLRLVKSTNILHFLFDIFTMTTFATFIIH